jgi:hypothetical protein
MNIHFHPKAMAAVVMVLFMALWVAYTHNDGGVTQSQLISESVQSRSTPSSPTLVICGADQSDSQRNKSSSIITVPCGPY